MIRRPPRAPLTDTLFPDPTLFRSLVATNNIRLHRTLGLLAYPLAPLMVLLGIVIIITVLRRTGGPFFFDQNEFLFSNTMLLMLFGAMVIVALRRRRHTGRSEEHTSELQSLMRTSYAVFCLKKKHKTPHLPPAPP